MFTRSSLCIPRLLSLCAIPLCALTACKKSAPAPTGANGFALLVSDCDPIVPSHCGFPFPSNVWRVQDQATGTYKLHFGETTLPNLSGTSPTDPTLWENRDGFAVAQAMLAQLPGATATGLPDENHLAASVTTNSPTIIMNADTGAFIPHLAELDAWAQTDAQRSLIIRPLQRLDDGTRYIVAVRHLVDASGDPVAPSPAFQALRDQGASTDGSVALRRSLYEDIFSKLAAQGIARADLQLAWDFTTASAANTQTDLLSMRDQALAAVGSDGPSYVITQIEMNPNQYIAQRIHGTMTVPFFLSSTWSRAPSSATPTAAQAERNRDLSLPGAAFPTPAPRPRRARWCRTATACSATRAKARTATWRSSPISSTTSRSRSTGGDSTAPISARWSTRWPTTSAPSRCWSSTRSKGWSTTCSRCG